MNTIRFEDETIIIFEDEKTGFSVEKVPSIVNEAGYFIRFRKDTRSIAVEPDTFTRLILAIVNYTFIQPLLRIGKP